MHPCRNYGSLTSLCLACLPCDIRYNIDELHWRCRRCRQGSGPRHSPRPVIRLLAHACCLRPRWPPNCSDCIGVKGIIGSRVRASGRKLGGRRLRWGEMKRLTFSSRAASDASLSWWADTQGRLFHSPNKIFLVFPPPAAYISFVIASRFVFAPAAGPCVTFCAHSLGSHRQTCTCSGSGEQA